jgi:hypothetical protein
MKERFIQLFEQKFSPAIIKQKLEVKVGRKTKIMVLYFLLFTILFVTCATL